MAPRPGQNMSELPLDINLRDPRWDQTTFMGRAKHFFAITNPLNLLLSEEKLQNAQTIVENYRAGILTPGLTEDDLWKAKYNYDSAFHPDTGEKIHLIGRMSAQVPMNMIISGCMLTFYRNISAVVFWQWVNQSFNAVVNYSNRSGDATITHAQLVTAYVSATTGAMVTAVGLKALTKHLPVLVSRFIPFTSVAAANCINIPLMRQSHTTSNYECVGEKRLLKAKAVAPGPFAGGDGWLLSVVCYSLVLRIFPPEEFHFSELAGA
ncbi:sideroflexin-3 isoform X3 [Macrotis lagotis]|uniref:sideroflexin-3 isoform X3 n=1 Tax=Macrotis lagotis TaxID=92651 RepID=UPI003D69397B